MNDVPSHAHGMDVNAMVDGAWLSVLPDSKPFLYSPDGPSLLQHDDGTFNFWCICRTERVLRNDKLTESQVVELLTKDRPEQLLKNLAAPRAAALMKQKMSDGFDWSWQYETFKRSRQYVFTVTFGRDGRVNHISDVYYTDLQNHRA